MTLTMSLGSFTSSTRSVPWLGRLFARTGHAGHAAAASRSGWSPEGTAGQGRTVRSPATAGDCGGPMALPGQGGARRWRVPGAWPLLVVLAVQAGLSLRLLRADTASESEALVPACRAPGMGALAARCADSAVPEVSLWRAGPLPAGRRGGGQHRRAGRCPGPVLGVHAWRHCPAVGRCRPACSGGGPRSSPPHCSPCSARPCTWGRSPPTTRCRCSWSRWRPGA